MSFGRGLLVIASAAAFGLVLRSVLREPVPLWLALASMGAYCAVLAAGLRRPRLQMFVDCLWHGPRDLGQAALLVRGELDEASVTALLAVLDSAGAHATFALWGTWIERHAELTRALMNRGHDLALLGGTPDARLLTRSIEQIGSELATGLAAAKQAVAQPPRFATPPRPWWVPRYASALQQVGLDAVGWSVRGRLSRGKDRARLVRALRPGALIAVDIDSFPIERLSQRFAELLNALHARGLQTVLARDWLATATPSSSEPSEAQ